MSMQQFANFFRTSDGEQIFYCTNFPIDFETKHEKVVLFNYGLLCSNHHWKYQLEWFDKAGYKILFHDVRGHFQSSGKDNLKAITFPRLADDIGEMLDHLKIQNVVAVGHSMGVNISLELARRHPARVVALALISGTVLPVKGVMFDNNLMEYIMPMVEEALKRFRKAIDMVWNTQGMNPLTIELIHSQGFNKKQVDREFIEVYMNRLAQLGPDLFMQLLEQMQTHDIIGYLGDMTMPALVVGGDLDRVIPFHLQRLLQQRLPSAELYIIKDGSHVPQVDFPERINERLKLFLEQRLS